MKQSSQLSKTIGICIPTMSINIDKDILLRILDPVRIGKIKDIHVHANKKYNSSSAFIRFENLNSNETVDEIIKTLQENKQVCLMYSFPEFIQCYKMKERKQKL